MRNNRRDRVHRLRAPGIKSFVSLPARSSFDDTYLRAKTAYCLEPSYEQWPAAYTRVVKIHRLSTILKSFSRLPRNPLFRKYSARAIGYWGETKLIQQHRTFSQWSVIREFSQLTKFVYIHSFIFKFNCDIEFIVNCIRRKLLIASNIRFFRI